ncbi:MAG: cytidylate kinase family protein [Spirochaetaceae bacterium]|nr:cytidylate kinase family protein [Spirochaetaceae bacterium]
MAIIAIARELASLGEETAYELMRISGYRLIDKEYLEKRLGDIGLSAEKREKYDEKSPGFWASLSQQRDDYLHFLKTAILEAARENDCIIMGRGGHTILHGVPNLLSVKITAPMAMRIDKSKTMFHCDNKRALQMLEQSDHDRSGFHKYFFSTSWNDPREFDMTICTANIDPVCAARTIDSLRAALIGQEKEAAGMQKIADLYLSQQIATEIIYKNKIPIHFLEVTSENGVISLHGVANTQTSIDSAVAVAHSVTGVRHVESAIQLVQEFTVMP